MYVNEKSLKFRITDIWKWFWIYHSKLRLTAQNNTDLKKHITWYQFNVTTTTPVEMTFVCLHKLFSSQSLDRKSRFKYLCHQIRLQQHYFLYTFSSKMFSQMEWKSGGKLLSTLFLLYATINILTGMGKGIPLEFASESSTGVGFIKMLAELLHRSIVSELSLFTL